MRKGQNAIPIGTGTRPSDWKNRFSDAVDFVETFDTGDDDAEPADILSFETLREAFVTLRSVEAEFSIEPDQEVPEQPDYDIDTILDAAIIDLEDEDKSLFHDASNPVVVNARLETIIEAILFVGNRENRPLCSEHIVEKLRNVSVEEVEQTVDCLNKHYQEQNCPYTIINECGGYRLVLRPEFESVRVNFYGKIREVRLSRQAIETLAVIAYRQPITAEEIQTLRRQSCTAVLNQLVRRNLLSVSQEVRDKKNVARYHTTPRFLELCKIKSLDDLPRTDELDYR